MALAQSVMINLAAMAGAEVIVLFTYQALSFSISPERTQAWADNSNAATTALG
jgi:hypothetical protein